MTVSPALTVDDSVIIEVECFGVAAVEPLLVVLDDGDVIVYLKFEKLTFYLCLMNFYAILSFLYNHNLLWLLSVWFVPQGNRLKPMTIGVECDEDPRGAGFNYDFYVYFVMMQI